MMQAQRSSPSRMFLSPCRPADDAVVEDFTSVCPSDERPPRRKQWHVAIVCAGQIWTVGGFSVRRFLPAGTLRRRFRHRRLFTEGQRILLTGKIDLVQSLAAIGVRA
jgi:hypothetical protein